jgi:hypothetical protein
MGFNSAFKVLRKEYTLRVGFNSAFKVLRKEYTLRVV